MTCFWETEYGRHEGVWLLRLGHKGHDHFWLASPELLTLGGKSVSTHAEGVEVHRQKSWGLPSMTSINSLKLWMSHLGTEPSSFSQAFRWKQLWPKSWLQPLMQDLKSHCPSTLILIHWNCVRYCLLLCKLMSLGAGWLLYYASVNNIYTQNVKKIEEHCFKSKKEYTGYCRRETL